MPKLKLLLILNSSSNEFCEYYPKETNQEFLEESKNLVCFYKNTLSRGIIHTKKYKYYYITLLPQKQDIETINEDHCFIVFICTPDFSEEIINKIFTTMLSQFNEQSYVNYKLSTEMRHLIIKMFLSYENGVNVDTLSEPRMVEDLNSFNSDFFSNRTEFTLDFNKESSNRVICHGFSDLYDENFFSEKKNKICGIKDKNVINKILVWKKAKLIFGIILVSLSAITFGVFPFLSRLINSINN